MIVGRIIYYYLTVLTIHHSFFLYTVSHPDKYGAPIIDLSKDKEAQADPDGLTQAQIALERVITKVFTKYAIPLEVTDRIRATFKTKLWRMGRTLSKLGGTKRQQQLQKWQEGKDSIWSLSIDPVEAARQLMKRKRHVEVQLEREVNKRHKIESEIKALKLEARSLHKVTRKQADTIVRLKTGRSEGGRGSSTKSWSEYSRQHRCAKKKALGSDIQAALSFCEGKCYQPISVELENVETRSREILTIQDGTFSEVRKDGTATDDDKVRFALYVKDKFSLSDEAYHEISLLTKDIPRLYKIKDLTKDFNSKFDIMPAPEGVIGVQQSLRSRLTVRLRSLQAMDPGQTLKIKLSGDGTAIARHLNVVNFTFTLLNEGLVARSATGNHTIAILQVPEKYDALSEALSDIAKEASELQSIELDGVSYAIEYFLGGDMKFIALVCGIDAANAEYSCTWCKCSNMDRWDMDRTWSAFDTAKGARTTKEIEDYAKLPKSRMKFNCSRKPLFPFIPIDHVIIDTLHLFLRISDLLTNLLIQELRRQDGIEKATTVKLDRSKLTNLTAYETFLNHTCKICFQWYVSEETKKLQWRDLTGPEKIRLFTHIDLPELFPLLPNVSNIHHLWMQFWRLHCELKIECDPDQLQGDIKNWVREFLTIYQTKNVTPYVHAFAYHVPEFVRRYGNITMFTQEGLEKLNDITTKHYQRSTNHRDDALKQALEKRNRIEDLEDSGYQRKKRLVRCGVCGQPGHNRRSCSRAPLVQIQNMQD